MNIDKQKRNNWWKIVSTSLIACVFIVASGILFSLITNFDSNSEPFPLVLLVWFMNMLVGYSIAYGISKLYKSKFKYTNVTYFLLTYSISTLLIFLFGGYNWLYVETFGGVVLVVGTIYSIYKYYKKRRKIY